LAWELKADMTANSLIDVVQSELREAIGAFIEYYDYQRCHEGLGNVTHYEVYPGRHLEIIQRKNEAKNKTLQTRRDYNRAVREQNSCL
jgi:hypothetical protein